jgi:hypothetical protein
LQRSTHPLDSRFKPEEVPEESEGVIQLRLTHVEKLKDNAVWLGYEVVK